MSRFYLPRICNVPFMAPLDCLHLQTCLLLHVSEIVCDISLQNGTDKFEL